jgi:hypothetical protein
MAEIEALGSSSNVELSYANWITEHMTTVPLTSHREFYRRHMNARYEVASPVGAVTHACQKGTRYRKYTFSAKDREKIVTIVEKGSKILLILDGFVRTMVDGPITDKYDKVTFGSGR